MSLEGCPKSQRVAKPGAIETPTTQTFRRPEEEKNLNFEASLGYMEGSSQAAEVQRQEFKASLDHRIPEWLGINR